MHYYKKTRNLKKQYVLCGKTLNKKPSFSVEQLGCLKLTTMSSMAATVDGSQSLMKALALARS